MSDYKYITINEKERMCDRCGEKMLVGYRAICTHKGRGITEFTVFYCEPCWEKMMEARV